MFFFSMLTFWFSRLSGGWKSKKWPKMTKISFCCTLYLRSHRSYNLHLWYTCMYKRIKSPGIVFFLSFFFFFFQKFLFSGSFGRGGDLKGKNWPKMEKNSACLTPYLRSYHMIVIFGKMMISPANFSLFQNFDFWGFKGAKRAKNDLKLPISVCLLYISRTVDYIIKILIMISTGVFLYFF